MVGSTEEVKVGNKLVRARQYPWGVVQGECRASASPAAALAQSLALQAEATNHCPANPLPLELPEAPGHSCCSSACLHAYLMLCSHKTPNHCLLYLPAICVFALLWGTTKAPSYRPIPMCTPASWCFGGNRLLPCCPLPTCVHACLTPLTPLLLVENENHCDFVKLREMLIRVNMEDLREQTHSRHYELYRRCKLEEMGFQDSDGDSQPFR